MSKAENLLKDCKYFILEQIRNKLIDYDGLEIYFHDIVSQEIDTITPQDRKTCIDLIDLADTQYFDSGLIDNSNLDRTLITSAYCSIEQNIFNDDFIQHLQNKLNNEVLSAEDAEELLNEVEAELKEMGYKIHKPKYEDNATQIFINTNFSVNSLTKEDFIKYGLLKEQLIDLSDSIKILTSNKSVNQNAIVIEERKRDIEKKKYLLRVYLMDKDKNIDIRNLFKLQSISEDTGFNLSPSAYIEQSTEQYEEDKKINLKNYLYSFKDKTQFIKQIVQISSKLTELTLK